MPPIASRIERTFNAFIGTLLMICAIFAASGPSPLDGVQWLIAVGLLALGAEALHAAWTGRRSLLSRLGPLP